MIELEKIKQEYDSLTQELTNPELISDWERFQDISKKRSSLEKIIKKAEELEELKKKVAENKQILSSQEDPELSTLAQEELISLEQQAKTAEKEIDALLKKGSASAPDAFILEIRPGTGGEEASLFARDLFDMYAKYAQAKAWKQDVLNLDESGLGGIKEASLEIRGEEAYEKLQYEGGVHRVQRIPETEKAGRVHTSTASVAVLPRAKKAEIVISPADIKLEFFNSSGPGGQNVNKRKTAVRLIYLPTNLVIAVQSSRTQQKNKEVAMQLLEAKLLEQKKEKEEKELSGQRKSQIGWAKRAEKIRTYNFPQDRITDHRIEQSWHGIEKVMEGNLDPIADALAEFQKARQETSA